MGSESAWQSVQRREQGNGSAKEKTMIRLSYLLVVATLAMMTQEAITICKRCNSSYYGMPKMYDGPRNSFQLRQSLPLVRDVSYLPEENNVEDQEEKQQPEHQAVNRDNRNLSSGYRNLCETVKRKVQLDDTEYEYQPPHYYEVYCKNYSFLDSSQLVMNPPKQKCVHPGFHCVQRGRPLFLVRRRWDSECWEPFVKEIASGCDCMWPEAVLGDITDHYSTSRIKLDQGLTI
ncbi:uncharacterized protein LOC128881948 isoform X2 [Hylaeus volcanicus]|uniref:uncharacterized protein LOC128881948 isoform X2 n=1 Tax=Hylaeus volcanicus TaxID=313075 RepID=UPI0023B82676|nr:uncharacterized protein LOC128881948 isoform X2 [Hylaeus volcanicus]